MRVGTYLDQEIKLNSYNTKLRVRIERGFFANIEMKVVGYRVSITQSQDTSIYFELGYITSTNGSLSKADQISNFYKLSFRTELTYTLVNCAIVFI